MSNYQDNSYQSYYNSTNPIQQYQEPAPYSLPEPIKVAPKNISGKLNRNKIYVL